MGTNLQRQYFFKKRPYELYKAIPQCILRITKGNQRIKARQYR